MSCENKTDGRVTVFAFREGTKSFPTVPTDASKSFSKSDLQFGISRRFNFRN